VYLQKSSASTAVGVQLIPVDGPGGGVRIAEMMLGGLAQQCGELFSLDLPLSPLISLDLPRGDDARRAGTAVR
jgi:hypothetical protein